MKSNNTFVVGGVGAPAAQTEFVLREPQDDLLMMQFLAEDSPLAQRASRSVIESAERAMEVPVRPVTAGKEDGQWVAPSGDPKDYFSLSPYWWPDPNTPDGTPYYRRDGEINPERANYDMPKLHSMKEAVIRLVRAYSITGDERYASRAAEHLRAWFVAPETRMNPSLRFAQGVPGVADGRAVGIIETLRLRWIPDSSLALTASPSWSAEDQAALEGWFGEFLDWLLTSELGIAERRAKNNHGTWYYAQAAQYAVFTHRYDLARELVEASKKLIASQIEPDGSQPHEIARTRGLHYCNFNTRAYLDLAVYGQRVGVDLLGYETENGRSVRASLDFLVPYMVGEKEWPHQQIVPPKMGNFYRTFRQAARLYDEPAYEAAIGRLAEVPEDDLWVEFVMPSIHDVAERAPGR